MIQHPKPKKSGNPANQGVCMAKFSDKKSSILFPIIESMYAVVALATDDAPTCNSSNPLMSRNKNKFDDQLRDCYEILIFTM